MTTEQLEKNNREAEFVALAAEIGMQISGYSRQHDIDGTFVTEAFDLMRKCGYFGLAVPRELGGLGATVREVTMAQRELARHCSSTALASSMHQHVALFNAWRYRRGMPCAEGALRKVIDNGLIFISTGGADQTRPRGEAKKVEGGYRVSGRKIFCSQSPVGTVMSTMFPYDDPEEGRIVLNMSIPVSSEGVSVQDNWDTMGMRGTGSNDIVLEDVFVADEQVVARRPYATLDPPFQVILSIALPVISGVYLGVAEAARDHPVRAVGGTPRV